MADDRTQYLIDLQAKFTGGDAAVATVASLTSALSQSAAALKVSNDAVSQAEAKYAEAEIAADRAAKAVEKLNASGKSGPAFAQKLLDAGMKADSTAAALRNEAAALDAVKKKAAIAAQEHGALTKGLEETKKAAGTGKVNEIAEALGKFGGPAGVAGQKLFGLASGFQKLRVSMGTVGPYIAIAVAIVAIATAAAFAAVSVGKWAVSLADASRTQGLLAAGIARSVEGGRELDSAITRLGDVVPQTREELLGMAGDLAKTGLRGKELTSALESAAVKAATLKFGPQFSKQLLAIDVQSRRLRDNLSKTFGGLNIEKLLGGVSTLVALFDSSTASGRALKFLFESLFQPLVDGAAGVIPTIERLFLHAEILAVKAYIALKPYTGEIKLIGEGLLLVAAVITGVVVAAFAALAAVAAVVVAGIGAVAAAFFKLNEFAQTLGANIVKGLVNGITGGATAVVNAMTNVVSGAIDKAKSLLGIASPSKVFEGIGLQTSAGFAEGVDGGTGGAQGSLAALVAPPKAGAGGAGGGVNLTIEHLEVHGAGAKEQADDFIEQITRWLESVGIVVGGGEAPTNA